MKGVQFNWVRYHCQEFIANCREAYKETKPFHYAWLLLLIVLIAWRLLEDSQFPPLEEGFPEVAWFASLWSIKDVVWIIETKIFWTFMEMDIHMVLSQRPRLSPTLFTQLSTCKALKVDFHRVYIQVRKNLEKKWHQFPYLMSESYVQEIVGLWPTEWCALSELYVGTTTGTEGSNVQKRKEATKKVVCTLVE